MRYMLEYQGEIVTTGRPLGGIMATINALEADTGRALLETRRHIAECLQLLPVGHTEFFGLGATSILVTRGE